jgi:hypothetical protein
VIPADTAKSIVPEIMPYVAKADPVKVKAPQTIVPATAEQEPERAADEQVPVQEQRSQKPENARTETSSEWKDEWNEEEVTARKRNVSFVLSGLTGTNAAQNEAGKSIFKRPEANPGPLTTGVRQTSTNSTYDIPLSFGAGIRVGVSPKWSIGAGVNYSMLSRKFSGTYRKVNEAGVIENTTSSDIRNTQHYIGIPVNAYYDIVNSRNVNFYAYAGGTVEKCISDKYYVLNTSIVHKEKANGVQWSANAGIGVGFRIGKHLGLYIDPSLRYYFDCGQPHSIRSAQPLMLGFEAGLKVYL